MAPRIANTPLRLVQSSSDAVTVASSATAPNSLCLLPALRRKEIKYWTLADDSLPLEQNLDRRDVLRELRAAFSNPAHCFHLVNEDEARIRVVVSCVSAIDIARAHRLWYGKRYGKRFGSTRPVYFASADAICACCLDDAKVAGPLEEYEADASCELCGWSGWLCERCLLRHGSFRHCALCLLPKQDTEDTKHEAGIARWSERWSDWIAQAERRRNAHWSQLSTTEQAWVHAVQDLYAALDAEDK